ncbi:uncharacterized protein LOC117108489 isoform X2 [Anneissia japonica]|uniref:uncharacterized protein LOC117108489 isoform X2 n=1 Tax=Anneissia japonica TaxID=1529436 RepID=UPI001425A6D6|nr:uncharacterized protein LOC117108489 isoform X2 [Anneissia japonica]
MSSASNRMCSQTHGHRTTQHASSNTTQQHTRRQERTWPQASNASPSNARQQYTRETRRMDSSGYHSSSSFNTWMEDDYLTDDETFQHDDYMRFSEYLDLAYDDSDDGNIYESDDDELVDDVHELFTESRIGYSSGAIVTDFMVFVEDGGISIIDVSASSIVINRAQRRRGIRRPNLKAKTRNE